MDEYQSVNQVELFISHVSHVFYIKVPIQQATREDFSESHIDIPATVAGRTYVGRDQMPFRVGS